MIDHDAYAEALYGNPEPAPSSAPTQPTPTASAAPPKPDAATPITQPPGGQGAADPAAAPQLGVADLTPERVLQSVPSEIIENRANDDERLMYDPQITYAEVIPDTLFDRFADLPPETSLAIVGELREMAADMHLTASDVQEIADAGERAMYQQALTQQQLAERWDECTEALNKEFGMGAAQAFQDMQIFTAADPRRAAILAPVGNDPRVVLAVARAAHRAKLAGKF
jgi:hypothetical protein